MCKEDKSVDAMLAAQMFELLMWSRKTLAFLGYLSLFYLFCCKIFFIKSHWLCKCHISGKV